MRDSIPISIQQMEIKLQDEAQNLNHLTRSLLTHLIYEHYRIQHN